MKPKVLLDIAYLGHGFDFDSHQRGMHRVASHLFDGLVHSDEVETSFVATSNAAGVHDFLISRGIDPAMRFKSGGQRLPASRLSRSITRYIHRTLDDRRLPARLSRRLLSSFNNYLSRREIPLTLGQLEGADIYHSPHIHIPSLMLQQSLLKCFITINDLIPVTNPEYYDIDYRPYVKRLMESLTERTFVFCISEFVRSETLRLTRVRPENVFVTRLAADRRIFSPVADHGQIVERGKAYGIPDAPYFLALSSHDRHKNFEQVISCFGELALAGELKEHHLVIAGPNPQRRSIVQEAVARYPGVKDRIIVTGYVAEEDLAAVYSGATAFLFPSLAEGFGIPALEAMQCGTPVIGSDVMSIPEVIGAAGILLAPNDREAWCAAMISLASDAGLREALCLKSIERAGLFSWGRFMDETIAGYKKSLQA